MVRLESGHKRSQRQCLKLLDGDWIHASWSIWISSLRYKIIIIKCVLVTYHGGRYSCRMSCWVFGYNTQLHWLPIHSRYIFQVLGSHLMFSEWSSISMHQITFVLYVPSRSRRSCDQGLLAVHCMSLKTKGDRAFSTVAPELWNSLPFSLRSADSVEPNTYLFTIAFNELF